MDIAKLKKEIESLTKENKSLTSERSAIQAKASDLSEVSREREEIQNKARVLEEDLKQTNEDRGRMEKMLAEERETAAKHEKVETLRQIALMFVSNFGVVLMEHTKYWMLLGLKDNIGQSYKS